MAHSPVAVPAPCHHLEPLEPRVLLSVSSNLYDVAASSYLGGAGDDAVRGAVIQDDGTIVLAANIGDAAPGGLAPVLLGDATAASSGALVRLAADGQTVLSVTRLADMVLDLSADSSGNLYVAMWDEGFAKVDADADSLLWARTPADLGFGNVQRIDAGPGGTVAVLGGGGLDDGSTLGDGVKVYDAAGAELGGWTSGKWKNDVCIDENSQTVVTLGYRNATDGASHLPVQISYYRGQAYDGTVKYNGYDWSTDPESPDYLNLPTNNMADTRGYRCEIGDDGLLYLAFESAGGNFIFRYDPFDISLPVSRAGGDQWNQVYNIQDQHVTIFGRYDPGTGDYIAGQELVCRLPDTAANTLRIKSGNIYADQYGRVYLGGSSSWGLPLPTHPGYSHDPDEPAFNPGVNGNYLGGAYLAVMSADLVSRLYCTRLTGGWTHAIAVRTLSADSVQLVFGGATGNELYILDADQPAPGGGDDGWFAAIPDSDGFLANNAPVASFTSAGVGSGGGSVTLEFDASASTDPDDDPLVYLWHFGDGQRAEGAVVQHAFPADDTQTVTLTVLDDASGWSQEALVFGPPTAAFDTSPAVGTAPLDVTFDASPTTDPNDDDASLTYVWDFGDGQTATGMTVDHRFERGGVFSVTLTATDPFGGEDTAEEVFAVAVQGGVSIRLDFEGGTDTAPGYTSVPLVEYTPEVGFGWQEVTGDFSASGYSGDALYSDYHNFSKYPADPMDGTFLVDLPNGDYVVLARFSHKNDHTFPSVVAEGVRELSQIHGSQGDLVTKVFRTTVEDGQLTLTFVRPWWFVSGLEIVDVGPALQGDPTASFTIDPASGEAPLDVAFDASGGADGLTYDWTFGDSGSAQGPTVRHTYAAPGDYPVTLTVSGGAGSRIVEFGGDYTSSSIGLSGLRSLRGVDADGDSLLDDTATFIDFGAETLGPIVDAGDARPSGRIYGGIAALRIDDPEGSTGYSDASLTNGGDFDYLNVRDQTSPPTLEHRAALLWIKDDFLAGAHAQRVYFDPASALAVSIIRWESLDAGRWLVQDGDQFYVSQAVFAGAGDHAVAPLATNWATYDPATPYDMDFDQDAAVFAARDFTDVRAVGVLLEQDGKAGGARVWYQIDGFQADASWAPVSGTVSVVEPLPRVTILATDPNAAEEDQDPGEFALTRTGSTAAPLTVNYTVDGTAAGADYVADPPLSGSVTIAAGSASVTIRITPEDDDENELPETVVLTLAVGDYVVESPDQATVTIQDNEGPAQVPFTPGGDPWAVTGGTRLQAEDFDTMTEGSGEGIAYHDTTSGNSGGQYRSTDVDVQNASDAGGGYNVGWVRDGEWLEFTVDVTGGLYNVHARVASDNSDPGDLRLVMNGTPFGGDGNVLGSYAVEFTGGWQDWVTLTLTDVFLPGGHDQTLRMEMVGDLLNVNWIEFEALDNVPPTVTGLQRNDGAGRPDQLSSLAFTFSEDVSASLDVADLSLYSDTAGTSVDIAGATLNPAAARWDLAGLADQPLTPAYYTATLAAAGIRDAAGNPLDGDANGTGGDDYHAQFLVAAPGDADLNARVDATDLATLGVNWAPSGTGAVWVDGDFDGDGDVDAADLAAIGLNWSPGGYAAAAAGAVASAPHVQSVRNAPAAGAGASLLDRLRREGGARLLEEPDGLLGDEPDDAVDVDLLAWVEPL